MSWWKTGLAVAAIVAAGAQDPRPDWSPDELKLLRSLAIEGLGPPPPDPTNRFAGDPAAAALGRALFSDSRFSSNGRVSCASCHQPGHGFTDRLPTASGVGTGTRRTMPVAQAAYSTWQFWDGRADSLWGQALGPVENPLEHGFSRTEVARIVAGRYRGPYERLFGPAAGPDGPASFPAPRESGGRQEGTRRLGLHGGRGPARHRPRLLELRQGDRRLRAPPRDPTDTVRPLCCGVAAGVRKHR